MERFHEKHGGRYDYSLAKYVNAGVKMEIICGEHGVFEQRPDSHWGGRGCASCMHLLSNDEAIANFQKVHGCRYEYSMVKYLGARVKINIVCREHGPFKQTPSNHQQGEGCPTCAGMAVPTQIAAIARFNEVHSHRYDYSMAKYVKGTQKIKIICLKHGVFEQTPSAHYRGQGCPSCCVSGFDPVKPAIMYYVRIDRVNQKPLYMIGITNLSFERRYGSSDRSLMTLVKETYYENGSEAHAQELKIKRKYAHLAMTEISPLERKGSDKGSSEIFYEDIMRLE